jgi:hypothetical protein
MGPRWSSAGGVGVGVDVDVDDGMDAGVGVTLATCEITG